GFSAASADRSISTQLLHIGEGFYAPSTGALDASQTLLLSNAGQRVGLKNELGSFVQVRAHGGLRGLVDGAARLSWAFGHTARIRLAWQTGGGLEGGAWRPGSLRHTGSVSASMRARDATIVRGTLLTGIAGGRFESVNTTLVAYREIGPLLYVEPRLWAQIRPDRTLVSAGWALGAESRLVRGEGGLLVQSSFGRSTHLSTLLQARADWRLARWLGLFGQGTLGAELTSKTPITSTVLVGLETGGALSGVGGTLLAGGRVVGRAFRDDNGNGVLDPEEFGVEGVRVEVLGKTAVSREGGSFTLRGLPPGTYAVAVEGAGYHLATSALSTEVHKARVARLDIPLVERKRVDIRVFADLDRDGQMGLGEWGVPVEGVTLKRPDGSVTVHAAPDGLLRLEDLPRGPYEVVVDPVLVGEGYLLEDRARRLFQVGDAGFQRVT
ncbi:MAG: carboxypeptidase regulatory-like domain-containing protein, partial [Myxococcales bacterium]|nr:carboxypeptidase regulatory-like domain-containing protein [Myxococcales bacterium]